MSILENQSNDGKKWIDSWKEQGAITDETKYVDLQYPFAVVVGVSELVKIDTVPGHIYTCLRDKEPILKSVR